jgi:hypothetical protein
MSDQYDSTEDTQKHILRVRVLLQEFVAQLHYRGVTHDASKLLSPEKEAFDVATPQLRDLTYGSDEYKQALADLGPALQHHYENNKHHPEHYSWHCPICNWQGNNATWEVAPQGPNDTGVRYCPRCCSNGMLYESELMRKPELGIMGMTLLDVIEMFCDWKAATERHANGNFQTSIQHNRKRFTMSYQLAAIFENTRQELML